MRRNLGWWAYQAVAAAVIFGAVYTILIVLAGVTP
jgi:ABC-type multidrug transport system permease subunit